MLKKKKNKIIKRENTNKKIYINCAFQFYFYIF